MSVVFVCCAHCVYVCVFVTCSTSCCLYEIYRSREYMCACVYVAPLNPNPFSEHPILEHPSACFFPSCTDQHSYSYKTQNVMQFRSSGLLCHLGRCKFRSLRVKRSFVLPSSQKTCIAVDTAARTAGPTQAISHRPTLAAGTLCRRQFPQSDIPYMMQCVRKLSLTLHTYLLCGTLTVYL